MPTSTTVTALNHKRLNGSIKPHPRTLIVVFLLSCSCFFLSRRLISSRLVTLGPFSGTRSGTGTYLTYLTLTLLLSPCIRTTLILLSATHFTPDFRLDLDLDSWFLILAFHRVYLAPRTALSRSSFFFLFFQGSVLTFHLLIIGMHFYCFA